MEGIRKSSTAHQLAKAMTPFGGRPGREVVVDGTVYPKNWNTTPPARAQETAGASPALESWSPGRHLACSVRQEALAMADTAKEPAWWPESQVVARFRPCLGSLASATHLLPMEEGSCQQRACITWLVAKS